MDRSIPVHSSSCNGPTGLGQTTSAISISISHGTATTTSRGQGKNTKGSKEDTISTKDSSSLQCFRCQGWGHMAWKCAIPAQTLNPWGNWGNVAQPPLAPDTTANSRPPAFPLWSQTKTDHNESSSKERMARNYPYTFPQPWLCCMLGGAFQLGPSDSGWTGNDHANWFRCPGLQHKFPTL